MFSGLAFAGVIIALVLQTLQLREQRQEIRASSRALEGQRLYMEKAAIELRFFQMIGVVKNIVEDFTLDVREEESGIVKLNGLSALSSLRSELVDILPVRKSSTDLKVYAQTISNFFDQRGGVQIKHFFAAVHSIAAYIEKQRSLLTDEELLELRSILRLHLTQTEQSLLIYGAYCQLTDKDNAFRDCVKRLGLEHSVDRSFLANNADADL